MAENYQGEKDFKHSNELRESGINELKRNQLSDFAFRKSYRSMQRQKFKHNLGSIFGVLGFIFFAILICRVFFKVNGSANNLNFSSFLNFLSNLNSVEVDLSFPDFGIGGSWGAFDFLRNFINLFSRILGVVVWLGKNIVNLLNYVIAIVNFLFS